MTARKGEFLPVLQKVGARPVEKVSQNSSRHYSERLSKEVALWMNAEVKRRFPGRNVLPPEGKVDTVYGTGRNGKSLDIAVLDYRGYLLVDVSIKTFNFRDGKTNNYRHNYTGRFYELLGEELDIRRSYQHAVLVALILLPEDSTGVTDPSCFAMAVRQFSKCLKSPTDASNFGFDFVFVGVHSPNGDIYFFDGTLAPPQVGPPRPEHQLSLDDVLDKVAALQTAREDQARAAPLPKYVPFEFERT